MATQVGAVHARTLIQLSPSAKPHTASPILGSVSISGTIYAIGVLDEDASTCGRVAGALFPQAWIRRSALHVIPQALVYPAAALAFFALVVVCEEEVV